MAKYKQPRSRLPDVRDLPTPSQRPRRSFDRPFTVNCDTTILDEEGDVLVTAHQMPRTVEEGMRVLVSFPEGPRHATVRDVDRFYGLVSLRLDG